MKRAKLVRLLNFRVPLLREKTISKISTLLCKRIIYLIIGLLSVMIIIDSIISTEYNTALVIHNIKKISFSIHILVIYIISIFIHEMGHIIYAKSNNCTVIEQGFSLICLIVGGYSLIKDIQKIKPIKKVFLYIFGSMANLLIFLISMLAYQITDYFIFCEISIVNIIMVIFNLSVLPYTDGFYILNILLGDKLLNGKVICLFKQKQIRETILYLLLLVSNIGIFRQCIIYIVRL